MYNFTELAVQLNEPEDGVAPTDTRLRPDQRLMEVGKWDDANKEKLRLEEKQRSARKMREMKNVTNDTENDFGENSLINLNKLNGETDSDGVCKHSSESNISSEYDPVWFKKTIDPYTNQPIHVFKNEYWDCKMKNDWSKCPDIY
jgi:hypothetical protein